MWLFLKCLKCKLPVLQLRSSRPCPSHLASPCRGPARTLVANACLLAHAVLRELGGGRWAKSAGVLHAAVDCLKHALKLTGSGALPCWMLRGSRSHALLLLDSAVGA